MRGETFAAIGAVGVVVVVIVGVVDVVVGSDFLAGVDLSEVVVIVGERFIKATAATAAGDSGLIPMFCTDELDVVVVCEFAELEFAEFEFAEYEGGGKKGGKVASKSLSLSFSQIPSLLLLLL